MRDEERLSRIMTKKEIVSETEKLEEEIEEIKKKKKDGWDVSESLDLLRHKFKLLEDAKKRVEKIENDKLKVEIAKVEKEKISNNIEAIHNNKVNVINPEKKTQIMIKRNLSQNDKLDSIFIHLNEMINRNINLYIIFHCCVFEKGKKIEDFKSEIISFLRNNQNVKIAFSVFYSDSIEKTPNKKFHDFKSFSKVTLVKANNMDELKSIRDEVIDINSDEKALSILCNIATFSCTHRKKEIETFMNGIKDPVQDLLDYKKILSLKILINEKDQYEEFEILENIKNFFDESTLNIILTKKKDSIFAEALFNLKRNNIKSDVEFKELMRSLSNGYKNQNFLSKNQFFSMESMKSLEYDEIFEANFPKHKTKIEEDLYIIHIEKKISISNHDNGYIAKIHKYKFCHLSNNFFLDAFDYSLCYKFLEIHETAKFFVNKFNEHSNKEILLISEAKVFSENRKCFFGIKKYIGRTIEKKEDARIRFKLRNPIIEAFLHFCFLFSKQTTVVIDLRTFTIGDQLLLTEPIIFSSFDKYGSSNLGLNGINYLMSSHICNSNCEKFIKLLK